MLNCLVIVFCDHLVYTKNSYNQFKIALLG